MRQSLRLAVTLQGPFRWVFKTDQKKTGIEEEADLEDAEYNLFNWLFHLGTRNLNDSIREDCRAHNRVIRSWDFSK